MNHTVAQALDAYIARDWSRLTHLQRFMSADDKREYAKQVDLYTADVRARGGK